MSKPVVLARFTSERSRHKGEEQEEDKGRLGTSRREKIEVIQGDYRDAVQVQSKSALDEMFVIKFWNVISVLSLSVFDPLQICLSFHMAPSDHTSF
jgi:hypothetical protein